MSRTATCICLLLVLPVIYASCTYAPPVDWARPIQPATSTPVFLHNLAIANPPYPWPSYPNYFDEPSRFEFHPRTSIFLDQDDTADEPAVPEPDEFPYLENGILYVDPNAFRTLP